MTTLPQTTPARLPQSAHAIPAAPVHAPSAHGGGTGFHMTGADVWRVIRNNLWLIILFLLLFGAAGYGANELLRRNAPRYTAVGFLEIRTSTLEDAEKGITHDMLDSRVITEQRTQAQLLKTDGMMSEVIKDDEIRKCDTFKPFLETNDKGEKVINPRQVREYLKEYFNATPVTDSKLLRVEAEAPKPEDARLLVDRIVQIRIEQTRRAGEDRTKEQTRALENIRDALRPQLQRAQAQLRDKQDELAASGAVGQISTQEIDYRALREAQIKAVSLAAQAEADAKGAKETFEKTGTLPEAEQMIENDPIVARAAFALGELNVELQISKAKTPQKAEDLQQRIDLMKSQMDARKAELRSRLGPQMVGVLQGKAARATSDLESITKELKLADSKMRTLAAEVKKFDDLKDKEKGLNELYNQVENRLRNVTATISAQNQSVIDWASHPETPEQPTFPRLKIILPIAMFLGLCLSLAIAFLRELLDDTVRRPSDVARVGQLSLLGMIYDEADDPQVAGAQLAIFDAPHSLTAEQFRQLRTRLQHAASLDTTRSIMVTGPGPEDGKTTVAVNLAAGLALNGRKILLVDSNFRRPEVHRLFGIPNERGFSDVLNGTAAIEELAHQSRVPNLTVLPSGPKPVNATELFESQLLIDFIDRALEEYDHVIFDSGPFLVVSEAVAMAPRVDGVVTVIRAHAESRGLLQRMRDSLRQIKAEHLGVVLNAVRTQGGGYYRRNIKAYYDYQSAA